MYELEKRLVRRAIELCEANDTEVKPGRYNLDGTGSVCIFGAIARLLSDDDRSSVLPELDANAFLLGVEFGFEPKFDKDLEARRDSHGIDNLDIEAFEAGVTFGLLYRPID